MTKATCISVKDLSKKYRRQNAPNGRGPLDLLGRMFRRAADGEEFFALKGLSFDVARGDRVGIVGRNGAGKSTLLKLMSRVAYPTSGEILIRGRLTSLLEVGTGFAADLSGRRNIYLNAGLHGLTRREIDERLEAIIDFSGVREFIDTPVKHYSSGMYVRLAFSVAAHLDPDILLLDEVLAVGDMAFQQKCLAKIDSLTSGDRTIIFVSHSLGLVAQYCNRLIWLDEGQVRFDGDVTTGLQQYRNFMTPTSKVDLRHRRDRRGTGRLTITNVSFEDDGGNAIDTLRTGEPVTIIVEYETDERVAAGANNVFVNVVFSNERQQRLFGTPNDVAGCPLPLTAGVGRYRCRISELPLLPGIYPFMVGVLIDGQLVDKVDDAGSVVVVDGDFHGTAQLPIRSFGDIVVHYRWTSGTAPSASPN